MKALRNHTKTDTKTSFQQDSFQRAQKENKNERIEKKKTKKLAFFIVLFSTLLITFAQLLLKKGIQDFHITSLLLFPPETKTWALFGGILFYGLSALLLIGALSLGELSVIYPVYATSYVWVAFLSFVYLHETFTLTKIIGISSILFGVVLLYIPWSKKEKQEYQHSLFQGGKRE